MAAILSLPGKKRKDAADRRLNLTRRTACSRGGGGNTEKTLVESASAIFDTTYLRYAAAENSKGFSGITPAPAGHVGVGQV
jgi:hypothetical protein